MRRSIKLSSKQTIYLPKPRAAKCLLTPSKTYIIRQALQNNDERTFFKKLTPELTTQQDENGDTLLHTAAQNKAPNRILYRLIKLGAENVPNKSGETPLRVILESYKDELTKKVVVEDFAIFFIKQSKNITKDDLKLAEENQFDKIVEELKNYNFK